MPEKHDAVALAGYLWRTPAAFRMMLRGQSTTRLDRLKVRADELPDGHREALLSESSYRTTRPQMRDGGNGW